MIVRKRKAAHQGRPQRNYQAIRLSLVRKLSNSGLKTGGLLYVQKKQQPNERSITHFSRR